MRVTILRVYKCVYEIIPAARLLSDKMVEGNYQSEIESFCSAIHPRMICRCILSCYPEYVTHVCEKVQIELLPVVCESLVGVLFKNTGCVANAMAMFCAVVVQMVIAIMSLDKRPVFTTNSMMLCFLCSTQ